MRSPRWRSRSGSAATARPQSDNTITRHEHAAPPPAPVHTTFDIVVSEPGFVNVAAVSGGTIAVRTYDMKGSPVDHGFHVFTPCNL